jgi:hypothetical protein
VACHGCFSAETGRRCKRVSIAADADATAESG